MKQVTAASPAEDRGTERRWYQPVTPSVVIAALVSVNLVYRWIIARPGYFWQDDFYITAWAKYNPLGPDYLLLPFSDHFQPLGFGLAWISQRAFPASYSAGMLWTSLFYAASIWVMYRLLVRIFGWRPQFYLVLLFFGFSIFTVQSYLWYAASLYLAPYLAFLPLSLLAAVAYLQNPRVLGLGLAFLASSLVALSHTFGLSVPILTGLLIATLGIGGFGGRSWPRRVLGQWRLLTAQSAPIVLIALYYVGRTRDGREVTVEPLDGIFFILKQFGWVVIPGLAGGPWRYNGYLSPEFPVFTPLGGFLIVEFLLIIALLAWVKPRAFWFWVGAIAVVSGQLVAVTLGRGGGDTALVIRYAAPGLVAFTLALAVSMATCPTESPGWRGPGLRLAQLWRSFSPPARWLAVGVIAQVYLVSFSISLYTPVIESPFAFNRAYMERLIASAKGVPGDVVLVPQFVPSRVVGVNAPGPTSTELVLANQPSLPAFRDSVEGQLWGFTDDGEFVEQQVWGTEARIDQGVGCMTSGESTTVSLAAIAEYWYATVSVGTIAEAPTALRVELLDGGTPQGVAQLEVSPGLRRTYAPLPGKGDELRFTAQGEGAVCVTDAIVGERFHWDGEWKQDGSSLPTQSFVLGNSGP